MKKIRIFLLISMLLFGIEFGFGRVQAAGTVNLTSNKSSINVGDEFTVSVNLNGMSVATMTIKVSVDTSKVDYISGPGNTNFVNGRVIYTWTDTNGGANPITSGTVATFKFKAKQSGKASFSVMGEFYDSNENVVSPSFSGTSVTLKQIEVNPPSDNTENNNNNNNATNSTGGTSQNTGGQTSGGQTTSRKWKFKK